MMQLQAHDADAEIESVGGNVENGPSSHREMNSDNCIGGRGSLFQ